MRCGLAFSGNPDRRLATRGWRDGNSPDKSYGLKGSMQHWLAVYAPEFEIPTFFVAVDSDGERFRPGPAANSRPIIVLRQLLALHLSGTGSEGKRALVISHQCYFAPSAALKPMVSIA